MMVFDVPGQHGEHGVGAEGEGDEVSGALDALVHVGESAKGAVHQRRHRQISRAVVGEERRLFNGGPASWGSLLNVQLCEIKVEADERVQRWR